MLLSEHIQSLVEMGAGAHYYSQSLYSSAYRKASTTIDLMAVNSKPNADPKNPRIACLSLGVIGLYGACDMGIESYDGKNWFPNCWSKRLGAGKSGVEVSTDNVAKVTIAVQPRQEGNFDYVKGIYTWYDKTGKVITTVNGTALTTELELSGAKGSLFSVDGYGATEQRFQRFMSLVPASNIYTPQYDIADESTLSAKLAENKLYYSANAKPEDGVTWGTKLMDYIWSVQGWNILDFSPGNDDIIQIKHRQFMYTL